MVSTHHGYDGHGGDMASSWRHPRVLPQGLHARVKVRPEIGQAVVVGTTHQRNRHDGDQYANNKLYLVQIRHSQPENRPWGRHPRVLPQGLHARVKVRQEIGQAVVVDTAHQRDRHDGDQ